MVRVRSFGVALAVAVAASGCAWVGRVGVSTSGAQPTAGATTGTDVSPSGRYVVFTSEATNLVTGDLNNAADVFWRDNQTGVTERVSVADNESEAQFGGYGGLVSADGRYVAFSSDSANLVSADTNLSTDVFLRDRVGGTTTRVSIRTGGEGDGPSYLQSMTPNARYIVFASDAQNLIGTADQNFSTDVYLRDRTLAKTERVSVASDGTEGDLDSTGGSISDDGRFVTFISNASNFDPTDSGIWADVFVRDRLATAPSTTRITALPNADEANADSSNALISGDGKVVAFDTDASNLMTQLDENVTTDVYARVLATGVTERISTGIGGTDSTAFSLVAGISDDARFVLFRSGASNLVLSTLKAASNSFVRDRASGSTVLGATSQAQGEPSDPIPSNAGSFPNALSGDGRYVLFSSNATDVIQAGDTNGNAADVFLRSNPVPYLFLATPSSVARGTTVTMSLFGSGLHAGALVLMGDGVTVNSVTAVSESKLNVSITVAANAPVGPRTPLVIDAGTGAGAFTGGITFLPGLYTVT